MRWRLVKTGTVSEMRKTYAIGMFDTMAIAFVFGIVLTCGM
jgi:hypothetical protein